MLKCDYLDIKYVELCNKNLWALTHMNGLQRHLAQIQHIQHKTHRHPYIYNWTVHSFLYSFV